MKLPHSHQLIAACMNLNLTSSRMAVLMALCHHYPNIYPGQTRIAMLAKVSLRTVKYNLTWLAEHGWITARRTNRTNIYTVNVERILRRRQEVEFARGATIALPEVQPLPTNNTREQDVLDKTTRELPGGYFEWLDEGHLIEHSLSRKAYNRLLRVIDLRKDVDGARKGAYSHCVDNKPSNYV